jgi:GH25 family lysozyme M1 (1,4-beta-N-acetylmuramidase)/uncharacterized protein YraI
MKVIIGPDVSVYEDSPPTPQGINFPKMRQEANFVFVRAGQKLSPDSTFKNNWSHAKGARLPRGSSWVYDSRVDPGQQAELWVKLLAGDLGELPLFMDLEEDYDGPNDGWKKWMVFLDRLKELVGNKEIGIYTAFDYWKNNAPNPLNQAADLETFHKYTLWIANYTVTKPSVPQPWSANEWGFWQFTNAESGKTYGALSQSIDLNFFNGDANTFVRRFNLPAPEEPHNYPPGVPPANGYRVTAKALNIRSGPGASYTVIGTLKNGDIVDGLGINADGIWTQIRRVDGLSGWCVSNYLIKLKSSPPPIPSGVKYHIITTAANIREGPGTSFTVIGGFKIGDIVEGLGINADGSWTQIRRTDGLTGWCVSQYLVKLGG